MMTICNDGNTHECGNDDYVTMSLWFHEDVLMRCMQYTNEMCVFTVCEWLLLLDLFMLAVHVVCYLNEVSVCVCVLIDMFSETGTQRFWYLTMIGSMLFQWYVKWMSFLMLLCMTVYGTSAVSVL